MNRDVFGRMVYLSLEGSHVRGLTTATGLLAEIDRLHGLGARFIKLMVATIPPSGAPRLSDEMIRPAVIRPHDHAMKMTPHNPTPAHPPLCPLSSLDVLPYIIQPPT